MTRVSRNKNMRGLHFFINNKLLKFSEQGKGNRILELGVDLRETGA